MAQWELLHGEATAGPFEEDHVVRMIEHGLPPGVLARPVGASRWKDPAKNPVFATAIARRIEAARDQAQAEAWDERTVAYDAATPGHTLASSRDPVAPASPTAPSAVAVRDAVAAPQNSALPVRAPHGAVEHGWRRARSAFWALPAALQTAVAAACVAAVGVPLLALVAHRSSTTSARTPAPRPPYEPRLPVFNDTSTKGEAAVLAAVNGGGTVPVFPASELLAQNLVLSSTMTEDQTIDFLLRAHAALVASGTPAVVIERAPAYVRVAFLFNGNRVAGYTLPAFVSAPPLPASAPMPTSVPRGTWAKIPLPGTDLVDTSPNRLDYISRVSSIVPGEPPINKRAAMIVMQRVRAKMTENYAIPPSAISVTVGDGAASITIASGYAAALSVRGEPIQFAACSAWPLASSLILADATHDDMARVGVRAILCKSDGCAAALDMRPTSPGGGLYGGESCIDADVLLKKIAPGLGQ